MNKLTKVALMTICVGSMLGLAGCGGDSPRALAIEQGKAFAKAMGVENVSFKVKEEKVGETDASIVLESVVDGKPDNTPMYFKYKKVDGKWKPVEH